MERKHEQAEILNTTIKELKKENTKIKEMAENIKQFGQIESSKKVTLEQYLLAFIIGRELRKYKKNEKTLVYELMKQQKAYSDKLDSFQYEKQQFNEILKGVQCKYENQLAQYREKLAELEVSTFHPQL